MRKCIHTPLRNSSRRPVRSLQKTTRWLIDNLSQKSSFLANSKVIFINKYFGKYFYAIFNRCYHFSLNLLALGINRTSIIILLGWITKFMHTAFGFEIMDGFVSDISEKAKNISPSQNILTYMNSKLAQKC